MTSVETYIVLFCFGISWGNFRARWCFAGLPRDFERHSLLMRIGDNQSTVAFRQEGHHLGALALAVGGRRAPFWCALACPEQPHGAKNVWDMHQLGARWLWKKTTPRVDAMASALAWTFAGSRWRSPLGFMAHLCLFGRTVDDLLVIAPRA